MKRALLLAIFGAAACRVAPPPATQADAERAHVALDELKEGRATLVRKCGNCHRPPLPSDHLIADWPKSLDEMSTRANLDVHQRRVIETYLVTMAKR